MVLSLTVWSSHSPDKVLVVLSRTKSSLTKIQFFNDIQHWCTWYVPTPLTFPTIPSCWLDFQHQYRKWCNVNNFNSMLPEDTKQRKEAALDSCMQTQQTAISDHFNAQCKDIVPYSNRAFEAAAIEWLIDSNQVHELVAIYVFHLIWNLYISANPDIQEHEVQEHAPYGGLSDQGCCSTNAKENVGSSHTLIQTKNALAPGSSEGKLSLYLCTYSHRCQHMQGPTAPGEINLTCNAWQADNTDAYFAMTGPLDRGACAWCMSPRACFAWVHADQLLSQWSSPQTDALQDHQLASNISEGEDFHSFWSFLAHLLLVYRLATLHVITQRIIPLCCKSSRSAINLRPGLSGTRLTPRSCGALLHLYDSWLLDMWLVSLSWDLLTGVLLLIS